MAIKLVERAAHILGGQAPVAIYDDDAERSEPEIDELADVLRSRGYQLIGVVDGSRKYPWLRHANFIVVELVDPAQEWLKFNANEVRLIWGEHSNWFTELGETNVFSTTNRIIELRNKPKEVLASLVQIYRATPPWRVVVPPKMRFTVPIKLEE